MINIPRTLAIKIAVAHYMPVFVQMHETNENLQQLKYKREGNFPFLLENEYTHVLHSNWGYYIKEPQTQLSELNNMVNFVLNIERPPLVYEKMTRHQGIVELIYNKNKQFSLEYNENTKIYYGQNFIVTPFRLKYDDEKEEPLQNFWKESHWIPTNRKKVKNYIIKDELGTYKTLGTVNWVKDINRV